MVSESRVVVLFDAYVGGTATAAEQAELRALINSGQHDDMLRNQVEMLWQATAAEHHLPPARAEALYRRIVPQETPQRRLWRWPLRVAAAFAVLVLGIWGYLQFRQTADRISAPVAESAADAHRVIKLTDGSTVMLHEGGRLDYPATFEGSGTREVRLSGEAYFDIAPRSDQPFVVWTGKTKTTVLGTAFTIREQSDGAVSVTVQRGKVKVEDAERDYGVLEADQRLVVRPTQPTLPAVTVVDKAHVLPKWIQGIVYFDDITLGEATLELERRFGVTIILQSPAAANCRFTAAFVKGERLEQILKVITVFNNAEYTYDNQTNTVRISGEGCAAQE